MGTVANKKCRVIFDNSAFFIPTNPSKIRFYTLRHSLSDINLTGILSCVSKSISTYNILSWCLHPSYLRTLQNILYMQLFSFPYCKYTRCCSTIQQSSFYFILFFLKFSSTLFLLIRHQRLYTKRFPILRAYHIYNAC